MRSQLVRTSRRVALTLPLLAGCVSMPAAPAEQNRLRNGSGAFARVLDSLRTSGALDQGEAHAPRVRIIAPPWLGADHMVDASIRVSEDAYVLVLAADVDGRMRVVFPESPDESGLVSAGTPRRLTRFFAGFGYAGSRLSYATLAAQPISRPGIGGGGTILAIASARPFQLDRIARDGEWDELAIERLLSYRAASSAAYAFGRALVLTGQDFESDLSSFTESAASPLYSFARYGSSLCSSYETGANYLNLPSETTFIERDGERYAVLTVGDACTGFRTQLVRVGPAMKPVGRDSVDTTRVRDPRFGGRTAQIAERGRFGSSLESGAEARRGTPVRDGEGRLLPADRPREAGELRFRPPEQLRREPRTRGETDGGARLPREARERARVEPREHPVAVEQPQAAAQPERGQSNTERSERPERPTREALRTPQPE